jgi:hypothetical protein|uniref:Uncharacterized protein n=1 Tax=uncultured bacterium contig00123 TaxID=1181580 RepID=A0A806KK19_9BACT|nr:hypothetical protein [uncultured bacterium contig00123]
MLRFIETCVFAIVLSAVFVSAQQISVPPPPPPPSLAVPAPVVAPLPPPLPPPPPVADYESFLNNVEAAISSKAALDKLKADISTSNDYKPNWGISLNKDADVETYGARVGQLREKISAMKVRILHLDSLIAKAGFSPSDLEEVQKSWHQKNSLYILRLERAAELMHDYIIQEQAKVLSTEKQKPQIGLGAYNAESQEYGFGVSNDENSNVLFSFSGYFKIPEPKAKEMNNQATYLTVSIDYVNLPFMVQGTKFFPGAKKAHVFYKDEALPTIGSFHSFPSLEQYPGYAEWKLQADSLISGALSPKNLDSSYAMNAGSPVVAVAAPPPVIKPPIVDTSSAISAVPPKVESGIPAQSASSEGSSGIFKTVLRWSSIGLCAVSVGLGLNQNRDVANKNDDASARLQEARAAFGTPSYQEKFNNYNASTEKVKDAENIRNAFYAAAGGFGLVGILTFVF